MTTIEAESGESVYSLIERAVNYMKENYIATVKLKHNDVIINAYAYSEEYDLCEKFEMQRKIDHMESQYRR